MKELLFFQKEASPLRRLLMLKAVAGGVPLSEYTATGNPLKFETNIAKPLKSLVIPWTPTQSGTGDPSPENVRPISGVSGLTVMYCGKNLLQGMENGEIDQSTGQDKQDATTLKRTIGYIPVVPSGKCVVSGLGANGNFRVFSYGVDKAYIGNANFPASDGLSTITVGATTHYIRFQGLQERFGENLQVELGETASTYSSYSGTSYPVTFPAEAGTVYGGSLNLTTGVLTATYRLVTLTGNEGLVFTTYGTSLYTGNTIFSDSESGITFIGWCSMVATGDNGKVNNIIYKAYSDHGLQFRNVDTYWGLSEITSNAMNAQLQEWYEAGTPLQVCYLLAEPLTWQLTPQEITSLIGANVLWSDTNGSNTAVYLKKG